MTLDLLKPHIETVLKKSTEDNKGTVEIFEENEGEENPSESNEKLWFENTENDQNVTNQNIETLDADTSKENVDSVSNIKLQSEDIESENETENLVSNRRKSKKLTLFQSDSENEDDFTNKVKSPEEENFDNDTVEPAPIPHKKHKRIAIIDSDSEDEAKENSQDSVENKVMEYKSVEQNNMGEGNTETQKKILSALCDSESSDENNEEGEDEQEGRISETELEALQSNEIIPKSRKGKLNGEQKEEKMTAKKALEQRKEILAESQRRVRESRVSLPYHKPKCRSLKEFLQNRPKLAAPLRAVSQGNSPSLSIKMSMKQLEVITQKMKEREKEMEEFYKSESESEPDAETLNDNTESTNSNEISTACNTETADSTEKELTDTDNNLVEMMNIDVSIDKNTETPEIMEKENSNEKVLDNKTEEICETSEMGNITIITQSEETNKEEPEETNKEEPEETNKEEHEENKESSIDQNTQSNENSALSVENFASLENSNPELELADKNLESKEPVEIEKEPEIIKKIVLISDIIVKPTEPNDSKNIYNLDDELLELASEVKSDETGEHDSYEFNLDGIEEESDLLQNGDTQRKNTTTKEELKRRKLEILEKVGVVKPRLSVGPNEILDLEKGVAMPDEISRLRERFFRHNLKSEKQSQKREISVLSVADGQIHKETLAFKTDENEEEDTKPLEKPGVRLQKLREELQHQMSMRRSDLWKKKLTKKSKNESLYNEDKDEEKSECDAKDILDNEEEEDFTDPEEDDEDLEENDCDMSEKKRNKSDFVDEEAEESEIEENEIEDNEEVLNEENEEDLLNENEEEEGVEEENEVDEQADVEDNERADVGQDVPKKKVLKRIIKAFEDDSDDENEVNNMFDKINKSTKIDVDPASENLLSSLEPPNFKIRGPVVLPGKSKDDFSTPVTYMTGLKNLNTTGSRVCDANIEYRTTEKSQLNTQDVNVDQNDGCTNSLSTQDVMAICSAEFPSSSKCVSSPEISTQQLKEVFTGSMKCSSGFNTQDVDDICSGGFTGASQIIQHQEKEVALDDKDEHLISQLIDEDELENFKKKFESPGVNSNMNITRTNTVNEVEEVVGTGGVIDSDDEETGLKLKNRKRKRLAFSDDEESSTSETAQEETIDLHDVDHDEDVAGDVEYDSEENEIGDTEENEKKKLKASDFFEEEAELSESEWGSADEDERNLDDLEFEKGDEEDFDQDKLRTDIEKLQMKQMLDEDNREVKMLQELLLEDGELHGSGRQRQFRWKNIDAAGNDNEEKKDDDDDDVYLEEDESEEKWRKERHEREMMKLKKQSQDEDDCLIVESQSLSFTHRSLRIKTQTTFSPQVPSSDVESSPKIKQPFTLLNKRGSFLSRGDKILQKIAETSKVSFTNKNTNRIVFQTIDEETKKRKASSANLGDSTPVALKKLRLSGLSPGLNKDRPKLAKSLFDKILGD